ncbi:MAG: TM0106 family RecB-like putative nuclease [Acidimicrobiales bacterium]
MIDSVVVASPSDLVGFLACEHLSCLDLAVARGSLAPAQRDDPELHLLSQLGGEHEARHLEALACEGLRIVRIPGPDPGLGLEALREAARATESAMASGVDVVFQATFFDGRWVGYADFLRRVEEPSGRWEWGYEVWDAKLARRVQARALLAACCYSEQLARVQASRPRFVHILAGDGEAHRYRLSDFDAFAVRLMGRFERWLAVRESGQAAQSYPEPVSHCGLCRWDEACSAQRRADDHLCLVAGMTSRHRRRLQSAGISTVVALARKDPAESVPGLADGVAMKLGRQARLQVESRRDGVARYELITPVLPDRGLARLPPPSEGDIFFDIEGDPFALEGGLEYLFGVCEAVPPRAALGAGPTYVAWWGHDRDGERVVLERFVDYVMARRAAHPEMHVYHYAAYEQSAVSRLAARHGTRQDEVDELLRSQVFVDLYAVARQALVISEESYSLKKLEKLYMAPRGGAIKDAGSSVVAYEDYLRSSPPRPQFMLDEIERYNQVDCESTRLLRDWLEERRSELVQQTGVPMARPEAAPAELPPEVLATRAEVQALADQLAGTGWGVLSGLLDWHRREDKPEWWDYFRRLALSDEELLDDPEALAGLVWMSEVGHEKQSSIHRYTFPPDQEFKIQVGSRPRDPMTGKGAGKVIDFNRSEGWIDLSRASRISEHPSALVPDGPVDTRILREALVRVGARVVEDGIATGDSAGPEGPPVPPDLQGPAPPELQAVTDLLQRRSPRLAPPFAHGLIRADETPSEAALRLAPRLEGGCLVVQGPPGSGKTYTGARMILEVIKHRRRVGITAMSHNAIGNLVTAVVEAAEEAGQDLTVLQRGTLDQVVRHDRVVHEAQSGEVGRRLVDESFAVVAGTPWLFARPDMAGLVDHLFVDEAGQLSLANVVAMGGAGPNLVLLGDPQQLAQPSKGTHPPGAGESGLGHFLGSAATVGPEAGIFLDRTWRMHPDITAFISTTFYEARLESRPECGTQRIEPRRSGGPSLADHSGPAPDLSGAGLRWVAARHVECSTYSDEEVRIVAELVDRLLGGKFTNSIGEVVPLGLEDIMVLAPYNDQVNRIVSALPAGARVGTVDRFQGQEAPVVIYSLTTSSPVNPHRGMEFLYSTNRLNVAVSRARAMAILVGSPALLEPECRTPEQMRMANALCRFVAMAGGA